MPQGDLRLMAHLMRRAGFGAAREELERYLDIGYEATVEELLFPGDDGLDEDIVQRYYIDIDDLRQPDSIIGWWIYRNVNSRSPLREKMALFYHGLFATRWDKVINTRDAAAQIDMFRRCGLGNFRTLLMELSRDPAMLIFLDNDVNLQATPNENYGRELMELFSMGDGAYTEDDVKACARAFTGWNVSHKIPKVPWGDFPREFEYRPSDHDDGEKSFLGQRGCFKRGCFNGEDIVDIIVDRPATARFIASKLYNFFVSDYPPPEEDLQTLSDAYSVSRQDIRSVMRALLNSSFFKAARFAKVKSPVDMVSGVLRIVGDFREPQPGLVEIARHAKFMGQELLSPPTVEGWHTGKEWIDTASLVARVNFATEQLGNIEQPGVRDMIRRLGEGRASLTPEELVDGCLDLVGPMEAQPETRSVLLEQARQDGEARFETAEGRNRFAHGVGGMLRFIVATPEFQLM
jgi:uncharacterized protein (DUF1800 family)